MGWVVQGDLRKKTKPSQTYLTKPTNPNIPNQICQTKPTKSNKTWPTKHTESNLSNQNYWSKQSTPVSVVPLAMFLDALASLDLKLSISQSFTYFAFSVNDVMWCDVRVMWRDVMWCDSSKSSDSSYSSRVQWVKLVMWFQWVQGVQWV